MGKKIIDLNFSNTHRGNKKGVVIVESTQTIFL
jgi:hypothetical protein